MPPNSMCQYEAFLIRVTKVTNEPIIMFLRVSHDWTNRDSYISHRLHCSIFDSARPLSCRSSDSRRKFGVWVYGDRLYGSCRRKLVRIRRSDNRMHRYPALSRLEGTRASLVYSVSRQCRRTQGMKLVHGVRVDPRAPGGKIYCQLVNDQARTWGGGVARLTARRYPKAQGSFSSWIASIPKGCAAGQCSIRAGRAFDQSMASLVGQQGYGPSSSPEDLLCRRG